MLVVIAWIAFSIFIGLLAGSRGRDQLGWFLLSLLISPLLALLCLMVQRERLPGPTCFCPHCKERIRYDATVCRTCHRDVEPHPAARKAEQLRAPTREVTFTQQGEAPGLLKTIGLFLGVCAGFAAAIALIAVVS
jgi:hypothetical protein